jgi:hypothetical protein
VAAGLPGRAGAADDVGASPRRRSGILLVLGGNGLVSVGENAGVPSGLAALLDRPEPMLVILPWFRSATRAARDAHRVSVGFLGVAVLLPGAPTGATWRSASPPCSSRRRCGPRARSR